MHFKSRLDYHILHVKNMKKKISLLLFNIQFLTKRRTFLYKETGLIEQYGIVSNFRLYVFTGSYRKISGLKFGSADLMKRGENILQPYHLFLQVWFYI